MLAPEPDLDYNGLMRRLLFFLSGLLPFVLAGCIPNPESQSSATDRPNLILIVLDEWGYYEASHMGHPHIRTPNIDRLADNGMRFTQFLAGGPVCGPTRATLMLGQHLGHASMRSNSGYEPIRDEDVTLAEVLKGAGYATGGFGKWGIGGRGTSGVPEKQGFDTFFGYYDQVHAHTYYPSYLLRNGEEVPQPGNTNDYYEGERHAQLVIFDEAMSWLNRRERDDPFFMYLPFTVPHGLWGFPEDDPAWLEFKDEPWTAGQRRDTDSRVYAAMLSLVDRQIGQIVAHLREKGMAEGTLILVSGDNGGQDYFASEEHPRGFFGPNVNPLTGVEFRGQKRELYEGGLRIPAIAYWPGTIAPGQVTDHLGYFPDLLPTFGELGGGKLPPGIDGISFTPTLLGASSQLNHEYLYWEYEGQRAVRSENWKAVLPGSDSAWELYDLGADISEANDVSAENAEILERLRAMADDAHQPIVPGTVFDAELAKKDHGHRPPPR